MLLGTMAMVAALASAAAPQQPAPETFTRKSDVVYSRFAGTALTMDEFVPKGKWNGATVIWVVSGGWYSDHNSIDPNNRIVPIKELIKRGYRVNAVVHRSNPYFSVEDAIADVERSIRFTRHEADVRGDKNMPIGIIGASAGGHLSLMAGTAGDDGQATASDVVEKTPSRVQAVACYFPPTDFMDYGPTHGNAYEVTLGRTFTAPFQFRRYNPATKTVDLITTKSVLLDILKEISPIRHVTKDDAPTLIIHGEDDSVVPIDQSERFVERMTEVGVEAKLLRRPKAGHGWWTIPADNELMYDWFDAHLLKR